MKKIIIGSRGSALALKQSNMVIERIKKIVDDIEFEIKVITTTGDRILDRTLDKIGGKGLFVKEIENALINQEIDLAIHSMKDVPNAVAKVFEISPILEREDARDVLITKDNKTLEELKTNAVIGTSSIRRSIQLSNLRKDLIFKSIRGNIDTRIKKLQSGDFDGIILAAAGLKRMGWDNLISQYLDENYVIPAVGQGSLCAEYRADDKAIKDIIKRLNKGMEHRDVLAERSFLEAINGGCSVAMGAIGHIEGEKLTLKGFYTESDNVEVVEVSGDADDYKNLGVELSRKVKASSNK